MRLGSTVYHTLIQALFIQADAGGTAGSPVHTPGGRTTAAESELGKRAQHFLTSLVHLENKCSIESLTIYCFAPNPSHSLFQRFPH